MDPISVRHRSGAYRVLIEPGLLGRVPSLLSETLGEGRRALVSDDVVRPLFERWRSGGTHPWGPRGPKGGWPEIRLTIPAGEASKSREWWTRLSDALIDAGLGRDATIIALGGGVVGDLAGFVAATYMRGIPVVQLPTTLLAMVDASVGGKTGVDTPRGKNLIGAFHPPALVVVDPLTLSTLDDRHYRAGLAEAVKHAVIADAGYFEWLAERSTPILRRDPETVAALVHRSLTLKRGLVEADEHDRGTRAWLNAGHTLGHALEHASGFRLLHGEAIALGLLGECAIAERLGIAAAGLARRVAALLESLGLPTTAPDPLPVNAVVAAGAFDKKTAGGVVRLALPTGLGTMAGGEGSWTVAVPDAATLVTGLNQIGLR